MTTSNWSPSLLRAKCITGAGRESVARRSQVPVSKRAIVSAKRSFSGKRVSYPTYVRLPSGERAASPLLHQPAGPLLFQPGELEASRAMTEIHKTGDCRTPWLAGHRMAGRPDTRIAGCSCRKLPGGIDECRDHHIFQSILLMYNRNCSEGHQKPGFLASYKPVRTGQL